VPTCTARDFVRADFAALGTPYPGIADFNPTSSGCAAELVDAERREAKHVGRDREQVAWVER
jgi:hypothetical protein